MPPSDDILEDLLFGVKQEKPKRGTAPKPKSGKASEEPVKVEGPGPIRLLPASLQTDFTIEEQSSDDETQDVEILSGHRAKAKTLKVAKKLVNRERVRADQIVEVKRLNGIFTYGESIPDPLINWNTPPFPAKLIENLKEFRITEPSPIQMQSIPIMLEKRDLLASAPTGSGKTLAFAAPVITEIVRLKKLQKYTAGGKQLAIVLEPTRELAVQTYRQFIKFSQDLPLTTALLDDIEELKKADVLVGTPKRLLEVIPEISLKWLRWLIVDESDRLFDNVATKRNGAKDTFRAQLSSIYAACNGKWIKRAFFSATYNQEVEKWCKEQIPDLAMVCIGERNVANSNVVQELIFTGDEQGKLFALRNLLVQAYEPPVMLFVQSKERVRQLETWFSNLSFTVPYAVLSSDCSQAERDAALMGVRTRKTWVLVCTELAGRGLDLPTVNLVINFDLPTTVVSYIHRIGRTGRAGRKGRAITYFTRNDFKYLRPIATVIHQSGFEVPEYTLKLKPIARKEKKQIYRHAIKRKSVAKPKRKRTHGKADKGTPAKKARKE